MNKISYLLFISISIFVVSISAYSQIGYDPYAISQTGFSGITGLTMIETEDGKLTPFYRVQLRPEMNLNKIGVGLDVVLLYNPDEGVRGEDGEGWDSLGDYLRMIRYFRYGHRREPLYFVYGALENMYIGHGLIMGSYSNYDRRGLRVDVNTSVLGVETILNNLADPSIFGGRIYLRPFKASDISLINRLTFGTTYMTDIEPNPGKDVDPLVAYSLDASIPLISMLGLEIYDELAFLRGHTKENKVGVGDAIGIGMEILNAHFKIEYRILDKYFIPTIFDYTYESSKPLEFTAGEMGTRGIYSMLAYQLPEKVIFTAAYEDYNGPGPYGDPSLYGELIEIGLIDRMSLQAFYVKRRIEGFKDIFDLDEKSALTVRIGFEVFPPLEFIMLHEFRFRKREDKKGFETIRKTSFELGVNVRF